MPQDTKKILIFLGPPGSGKGTQATRLAKELGIPHISTGDLFRKNMKNGTELGKKVQSIMDSGNLVPDELVLDMLFDRVAAPDCKRGYILDGFPRRLTQADALRDSLQAGEQVLALNLEVPDEEIVARITGRLTCRGCGSVFHKNNNPPKVDGVCDRCGGELVQRSDDTEEVVRNRLLVYKDQTQPLIEYYEKQGVLVNVDGDQAPDAVFAALVSVVAS
ncbi:MAG: adenylate kinase [Chlamydiae bacterium]|nr:adenylate kinase [Chlamydiota bacterium]